MMLSKDVKDAYRRHYPPNVHERELKTIEQKILGAYVKQRNVMWENVRPYEECKEE